jgi:hypothetical protein
MSRAVERLAKDRERHVSIVKAALEQALHDAYGVIDIPGTDRLVVVHRSLAPEVIVVDVALAEVVPA